jgi:hypothetical protein
VSRSRYMPNLRCSATTFSFYSSNLALICVTKKLLGHFRSIYGIRREQLSLVWLIVSYGFVVFV